MKKRKLVLKLQMFKQQVYTILLERLFVTIQMWLCWWCNIDVHYKDSVRQEFNFKNYFFSPSDTESRCFPAQLTTVASKTTEMNWIRE